jgi:hypothetical protein
MSSHSWSVTFLSSLGGAIFPALLTHTSMPPYASTVAAARASTSLEWATSRPNAIAVPPAALISATAFSAPFGLLL